MRTGRVQTRMGFVMLGIAMLAMGAGCASKQVASTSGDASTTMKSKAGSPGPVESVQQEQMASVPTPPEADRPPAAGPSPSDVPSAPGTGSVPSGRPAPGGGETLPPGGRVAGETGETGEAKEMTSPADIFFDFDQYNIRSDAQTVLAANAAWLRSQSGKSVLIEGHCDERGTLAYNLVLGEKRAKSTKRYLEDLGIPGSRIQTTSYGEVRPFCKEHNEGCWSKNRRAHFVVQ
jgi:peptidoglycan-associated lipoprotein